MIANRISLKFLALCLSMFVIFLFPQIGRGKEITIKITDSVLKKEHIDSKKILHFKSPGVQKLTIANYSKQDLELGNIYFIGDEFTAPLIAKDFSIHGSAGCKIIPAGTTCSVAINASSEAVASLNPKGEQLFLGYKIVGSNDSRSIQFKVQSSFNDDLRFKPRNIEFKKNDQGELVGELTITNNSNRPVYIKKAKVLKDGGVVSEAISGKSSQLLQENESCIVGLKITNYDSYDLLPIWVEYEVIDNPETKKNLVAIAAAIIDLDDPLPAEHYPIDSSLVGAINYGTVKLAYGDTVRQITRKIVVAVLGNGNVADHVADGVIGLVAGTSYVGGGEVTNYAAKYDYASTFNQLLSATTMHILLSYGACSNSDLAMPYCMVASVGCGVFSGFAASYIANAVYSNVVHRLPEQGWLGFFDKTKMTFNFGLMTVLRVGCKTFTKTPNFGLTEIYQETLAGSAMDVLYNHNVGWNTIKKLFAQSEQGPAFLQQAGNNTFTESDNCGAECVCSELRPISKAYDEL